MSDELILVVEDADSDIEAIGRAIGRSHPDIRLEFVRHGVNGLVCEPDPAAIGACLAGLGARPDHAASLGEAGYDSTRAISWDGVVAALTAGPARREEPPVA